MICLNWRTTAINSLSKRFAIRDWGRDKTMFSFRGGGGVKLWGMGVGWYQGKFTFLDTM